MQHNYFCFDARRSQIFFILSLRSFFLVPQSENLCVVFNEKYGGGGVLPLLAGGGGGKFCVETFGPHPNVGGVNPGAQVNGGPVCIKGA